MHAGTFSCKNCLCILESHSAYCTETWFPASLGQPRVIFARSLLDLLLALQRQQARFSIGAAALAVSGLGNKIKCDEEALAFALYVRVALQSGAGFGLATLSLLSASSSSLPNPTDVLSLRAQRAPLGRPPPL